MSVLLDFDPVSAEEAVGIRTLEKRTKKMRIAYREKLKVLLWAFWILDFGEKHS